MREEEVKREIASFCRLVKGELFEEKDKYSCMVDLEGRGVVEVGLKKLADEEGYSWLTIQVRSEKTTHLIDAPIENIWRAHAYELRLPDGSGNVTWRMDTKSFSSVALWVSKLKDKPVFAQIDVGVR